jgi:hypothetical protein
VVVDLRRVNVRQRLVVHHLIQQRGVVVLQGEGEQVNQVRQLHATWRNNTLATLLTASRCASAGMTGLDASWI